MMEHGGNIYTASRKTGIPERRIVDFSASINPLGLSASARIAMSRQTALLGHYPEPYAEGLIGQISHMLGLNSQSIICGNGSTELIYLIPRVLKPNHVLVAAPTFSEYEKACRMSSAVKVVHYKLSKKNDFDIDTNVFIAHMKGISGATKPDSKLTGSLAFLCNPNNPTGRIVRKDAVLRIAEAAKRLKCYLVVDEAFIDFCPGESIALEVAGNPYLMVLRSLTKFYALAGLRLGYGIFPQAVADMLRKMKEPWTINRLAAAAGSASMKDTTYQKRSLKTMDEEKLFMEEKFKKIGIRYLPSRANYYLLQIDHAHEVVRALEEKGILVRDCSNFNGLDKTYIRVAVRSRKENSRLIREVARLCRE
ncbi:MAG: threonine-phosphate decarboxylase CobD [Nitrospiraceae bacterium]|nr:threonine-phosphate decarboxylase CobD [Nitrospiraceae bacterium]